MIRRCTSHSQYRTSSPCGRALRRVSARLAAMRSLCVERQVEGGEAHPRPSSSVAAAGVRWPFVSSQGKDAAMSWTPSDLLTVAVMAAFVVSVAVAMFRLVRWRRSRLSDLRVLTGTRQQQAALVRALRPVVREYVPQLHRAGLEINSIALLPALAGPAGEALQAQVEQADGSQSFTIRLACSASGNLRRPEDVAGALADELL